jgi:hypothetical protein
MGKNSIMPAILRDDKLPVAMGKDMAAHIAGAGLDFPSYPVLPYACVPRSDSL